MNDINIDNEAINEVLKSIENADENIKLAKNELITSLENIKSSIMISIKNNYLMSHTELRNIDNCCIYAINGISSNASAYMNYENSSIENNTDQSNISLNAETSFYWGYPSNNIKNGENQIMTDIAFFQNLAKNGIGNIKNGIYYCNDYSYDPSIGKLTCDDKSIFCRIYYPEDSKNLNDLNVTTVLLGDNGRKAGYSQFVLDKDNDECSYNQTFGKVDISSVLVVVQSPNGGNNAYTSNGVNDSIVNATKFTNEIIGENKNRSNAIVGYSSGGFSSLDIAASNGKDTYDTVVVMNSYLKATGVRSDNPNSGDVLTQLNEIENLKNKEIIFMEAKSDGKNNELNIKGLPILKKYGCENVKFLTSNNKVANKAEECGYNTYRIDDSYKWDFHGAVGKMIKDSNIMDYLGNK